MTGPLEHARAKGMIAETGETDETMARESASEALGETTPETAAADQATERVLMSPPQATVACRGGLDRFGVSLRVPESRPGAAC